MRDFGTTYFWSALAMFMVAWVPLMIYALRSVGIDGFTWRMFFIKNRLRLAIGFVLMNWIAVLFAIFPDARPVVGMIGTGGTDAAIGFAIGNLLAIAIGGKEK